MTPKEQIEQAAKKHAVLKLKNLPIGVPPQVNEDKYKSFKAGAEHVLQHPELMREVVVDFAKWVKENFEPSTRKNIWYGFKKGTAEIDSEHTAAELFTLYLEHINQKQ